ncbi:hypothetical protein KIN20_009530 [Parelaphostrongylus tenuis]|uniref:Uncharacterized protein n=1 Tax=Parelaphostrongylus tenuis TaxID=148309 RepID=A0AAD5QJP1_PARTN|nr:hypothetical protein KIN20_009530 [Parelaphostrongylus tenuis]
MGSILYHHILWELNHGLDGPSPKRSFNHLVYCGGHSEDPLPNSSTSGAFDVLNGKEVGNKRIECTKHCQK